MTERSKKVVSRLLAMYPDATTELNYGTALDLLVAVVLSAQTSDSAVNSVTDDLFSKYKSAKDYAVADRKGEHYEKNPRKWYLRIFKVLTRAKQQRVEIILRLYRKQEDLQNDGRLMFIKQHRRGSIELR
jgi:hypothetical protein